MEQKAGKWRKIGYDLTGIVCAVVIIVSAWLLYDEFVPKAMEVSDYNNISDEFGVDEDGHPNQDGEAGEGGFLDQAGEFARNLLAAVTGQDPTSSGGSGGEVSAARSPGSTTPGTGYDWGRLLAANPQTVGWIYLPGTHIDYPVVQTGNNDDYLGIDFYGEPSVYGNPFVDYRFDFHRYPKSQNMVIYGHSSQYGNMIGFEGLENYVDYNYYRQHPCFYFTTIYEGGPPVEYDIVAVLKEDQLFDYRHPAFEDQKEFMDYYRNIKASSIYDTGIEIRPNDDIVTLSTCVFDMYNGRCAVVGRRVPPRGTDTTVAGEAPQ